MTSVSLDGLFKPVLETGLEPSARADLRPELQAAHTELMQRRGKDLGFYDAPYDTELIDAVLKEAKRLRALADNMLVLGIGGSSLGGQALTRGLANTCEHTVRLHYIDNVDPDTIAYLLDSLDPAKTATCVITKSGGTVETLAQLLIIRRWYRASIGEPESRSHMVFITDPQKGLLRDLANSEGIRSFEVPPNIGGRFSVLTPVGLLPAAYLGIDIKKLCQGAVAMVERVTSDDIDNNPACQFAAAALLAKRHLGASSLVMMPYSDALRLTSHWFVQLWAESLGKRVDRQGREVWAGQTPIAAIGAADQHAQLQLFVEGPRDKAVVLIGVEKARRVLPIPDELAEHEEVSFLHGRDLAEVLTAERRATRAALLNAGVPVIDVHIPTIDEPTLGGLFVLFEAACACTGIVMDIDPFDQPGVEAGKRMALGLLGRPGFEADAKDVLARESVSNEV